MVFETAESFSHGVRDTRKVSSYPIVYVNVTWCWRQQKGIHDQVIELFMQILHGVGDSRKVFMTKLSNCLCKCTWCWRQQKDARCRIVCLNEQKG
jgi:hypothetical protein